MTQVKDSIFGLGTVLSSDKKTVTVDFNGDIKRMMLKFANLTNADGTVYAPAKAIKEVIKTYPTPAEYEDDRNDMQLLLDCHEARFTGEWA